MIWACSPEFFEHRRQLRRLKPRPAGRLANAWHTFVNFTWYCILNDASTDNVEQVLDEAVVVVPSNQGSVVTTRSILIAELASNSSGTLQQSNSIKKRRSSSLISALLPRSSVAPLPSSSPSSPSLTSSQSTSPSSSSPPSPSSIKRYSNNDEITLTTDALSSRLSQGTPSTQPLTLKVSSSANIVDMRIDMDCNDHIRIVHGGTIPDVDRLIKRTLDWGMSSVSFTSPLLPTGPMSSVTPVKQHTNYLEKDDSVETPIVSLEVLLGLKKPNNDFEAMIQQREFNTDTPYWMIDESRDKESHGENASRDGDESRDGEVDSGVASRVTTRNMLL